MYAANSARENSVTYSSVPSAIWPSGVMYSGSAIGASGAIVGPA